MENAHSVLGKGCTEGINDTYNPSFSITKQGCCILKSLITLGGGAFVHFHDTLWSLGLQATFILLIEIDEIWYGSFYQHFLEVKLVKTDV